MKREWHELISRPQYHIKAEKNVYVKMRDGAKLCADIYRPDAKGKFPALLAMSPYGKELQTLSLPPQSPSGPLWDGVIEAGETKNIVPRGYAHVIADIRGTGYSEGEYVGVFPKKEGEDGYDLVEWIAQQPWCNGNIGMIGMSYFGGVQLRVAVEQPPHLKAIMPVAAWSDTYRHVMYPGGVLCLFWYGLWDGRGGDSGYAMKSVLSAMATNLSKQDFANRLDEALNNPDIQKFPNLYHLLKYPQKNPIFVDILLNPCDGPFYWERSAVKNLEKINVPVFPIGGWLRGWLASGAISIYNGVNTPKKLIIDSTGAWPRPWVTYQLEAIRWFDHWLKGLDTGIMDEPPIEIFVRGLNQWRHVQEWPPASIEPTAFYLRSFGSLSLEPEKHMEEPDCFVQQPLHVSYEIQSLKYTTLPFSEDLEVTGPIAFYLFASIDQEDTNWIVALYDVDENTSQLLSLGYLKASHRALDKSRSKPLQPYHTHTQAEPVVPGKVFEYAIELSPISFVFKAGHRLMLEIRSLEHWKEPEGVQPPFSVHLCSSRLTIHKVFRDRDHTSHLLLPIFPNMKRNE